MEKELANLFGAEAKVVISPDKMRAWITLPPPPAGMAYTVAAVTAWLPQWGVVFGVDAERVRSAVASGRYRELLEVARGRAAVAGTGASYTLLIENRPFTGLKMHADGSLMVDDLSFLQEAAEGQVLAEVVPAKPGVEGMTVTGEAVRPRAAEEDRVLAGSGFAVSTDGRQYLAPALSHVGVVNGQLVVTPLLKLEKLTEADGPVKFEGNVLVEKDLHPGAQVEATGSVFVVGRAVAAKVKAGNNLLISGGMSNQGGFSRAEAAENIWGAYFEGAELEAGGDIGATHLTGCEAQAGGRANIIGGRGTIANTNLYAKNGIIAQHIGGPQDNGTTVAAGMGRDTIAQYENLERNVQKLTIEIQSLQQNIATHERLNRMKEDKGRNDPKYKDMCQKRQQALEVLGILNDERTRQKRMMEQFAAVSIIARDTVWPGVTVEIDTRSMQVMRPMHKAKFRRVQENIEATSSENR